MNLDFVRVIRDLIGIASGTLTIYISLLKLKKILKKKRNDLGKGHSK